MKTSLLPVRVRRSEVLIDLHPNLTQNLFQITSNFKIIPSDLESSMTNRVVDLFASIRHLKILSFISLISQLGIPLFSKYLIVISLASSNVVNLKAEPPKFVMKSYFKYASNKSELYYDITFPDSLLNFFLKGKCIKKRDY